MIAISDKSRLAVDALVELDRRDPGHPVPILEIAERRGIAVHVLEQIFTALRRAGILQSQRGVKGGYTMRRPGSEVTVLAVVEAIEGPLNVDGAGIWADALAALSSVLSGSTIADLVHDEAAGAPMFHI